MSKAVCRSCKHFEEQACVEGMPLYPGVRDDCWMYRNKGDRYNLATNSKGNSSDRLKDVWEY